MEKKVSLVLSGGGARGIAHIGVIEELLARDFQISSVAGASMGALVGGVFALGKLEEFKKWLIGLDKRKIFSLVDFTLSSQGLVKGDRIMNRMKDFIPDAKIEELDISYCAIATDLKNKKEIVFRKGSVYDAIRASIAIPTVFTPVETASGLLVDGGVVNNIPVNHVKRSENDLLIAVNVNADVPVDSHFNKTKKKDDEDEKSVYRQKITEFYEHIKSLIPHSKEDHFGYFDLINNTIAMMTNHIAGGILEKYPPEILIETSRDTCGTFDFYRAEELIQLGRRAAIKKLDEYEKTQ